ncbi:hypothetical protein ACFLXE_03050 [Chloroflexota bacterium]
MRQISFQAKMKALELYVEGLSTNEIVDETVISKGAVVSILRDAREGKFPDLPLKDRIDELHDLSVRLRKGGLDLAEAKLGFAFFKRLTDLDIQPDKLKEWIDFCSQISPDPPEEFIPAAMELFQIERQTGKRHAEIASEVKELSDQREKLTGEVADLRAKEARAKELKSAVEKSEEKVKQLRVEEGHLERNVDSLKKFLRQKAKGLGITPGELESRLGEMISLEDELADMTREKNRLIGEIEALTERQERLSARMEKASADFKKDLKLMKKVRGELAQMAQLTGKYKQEIEHLEWAQRVLPFLSDPDKVPDDDFSLASIVVNCVDKWLPTQSPFGRRRFSTWDEIQRHVQSKRNELG